MASESVSSPEAAKDRSTFAELMYALAPVAQLPGVASPCRSTRRTNEKHGTSVGAACAPLSVAQAAALGLVLLGQRDYRWAAETMSISPVELAALLRSGLHELASPHAAKAGRRSLT